MNNTLTTIARHIVAASLVGVALGGCSTTSSGMGGGDLIEPGHANTPVLLSWQSGDGGISGTMAATLPDATYQGPFVQITHETTRESIAPMWLGWNEGWGDWPFWTQPWADTYDANTFVRDYSGKVLANLQTTNGQSMRCRFILDEPESGMSGGGQGRCELAGGQQIRAIFERQG